MRTARAARRVAATPASAFARWVDVARWPAFVDGCERVESVDPRWPEPGAEVRWRSVPGGRGDVVERALAVEPGRSLQVEVADPALTGVQTVTFEADEDGAAILLDLSYDLRRHGPLRALTDVLFVRRALADALERTLRRFAAED